MYLLEDLKMSLLNINFFIIYIIHKMLVLLKKILFWNALLRGVIDFFLFFFK